MLQSVIRALYPPQCLSCGVLTDSEFGLCGPCWAKTPFIGGLVCDLCGAPLPGEDDGIAHCDDCLALARPWSRGRAALEYRDGARRLALAFKHGDRTDLARPMGRWLAAAGRPIMVEDALLVPVPLHWSRLLRRRYNQAALLAQATGQVLGLPVVPDLLIRPRRTPALGGRNREERFAVLADAIRAHPRHAARAEGRTVVLVDDVMTTGATLAACAEALRAAGAGDIRMLTLARAGRTP